MIKCNLSKLMGEKKLKITDVVRDTGINRGTVTRLYHETTQRIEFDALEILCRYFHCTVGDLIELSDESKSQKKPDFSDNSI